jgi:DNA-binding SARP family transcriptional activator/Flp pilus assembly protein TadD
MPFKCTPAARLYILGSQRLITHNGRNVIPKSGKARALIAYTALSPSGNSHRSKTSALLWSESVDAKASLRQCIKETRKIFTEAGLDILSVDIQRISLDLGSLWVDALEVERLARSSNLEDLKAMVDLYSGDLLENTDIRNPEFEEWLLAERNRLRRTVCDTLENTLRRSLEERGPEWTDWMAAELLVFDPANEQAHRTIMRRHASRGDIARAIRQYQACRNALARELDLTPSPETEALLRRLRRGEEHRTVQVQDAPSSPAPAPLVEPVIKARSEQHPSVTIDERVPTGDGAADAIVAVLATALRESLSRKRWLSVRNLTQAQLILPADPGPAAPEPHYHVTLSCVHLFDGMRFCAELQEEPSGRIIWSNHYDRALGRTGFDIIDDLARVLACRLDREIELAEILRASRQSVESLSAYDCVLRAIPLIFKLTPKSYAEAEQLLCAAQDANPHDALVYSWRAFWHTLNIGQNWARDLEAAKAELRFLVQRALELDPKDALALAIAGHIASFIDHDYGRALDLFKRSLWLDPNSPYARDFGAVTLCYAGNAQEALRQIGNSREIWQHPAPFYIRTTACIALFLTGQNEQAAEIGRRVVRENRNFQGAYRPLIASLGFMGEVEEARTYISDLQKLQPDFSIDWFRANYPPLHGDYNNRYIEGLCRAGVS